MQISGEMGVSEAVYGWGLGSFFLAATVGSILLGRLAQRIGPGNQMTAALAVTALVQVALAATARSFLTVIGFLVVAGLANAANQTAVNLALARAELPRLGLAVSAKQSGMPAASLLAGFAVPGLALTVGWRWAYVTGAALAVAAVPVVRAAVESAPTGPRARAAAQPVSSFRSLVMAAVAGGFLSFSAGTLNAWTVGSGVDAGLDPGSAGLFLGIGAGAGIVLRMAGGYWSDTMRLRPFRMAGLTGLIGAASIAALALRAPGPHVAFTLLAFGGGWIWPAFTNFWDRPHQPRRGRGRHRRHPDGHLRRRVPGPAGHRRADRTVRLSAYVVGDGRLRRHRLGHRHPHSRRVLIPGAPSSDRPSHNDDLDQASEPNEVVAVAGIERQTGGEGGGGDEEINGSGASRFPPGRGDRAEDSAVGAGRVGIERKRVKSGFGALESVLPTAALVEIAGGAGTG